MNLKQYFKEQEGKLRLEALLKSTLAGAIVGGAFGFIAAFVTWLTDWEAVWVSIAVILGVTLIAGAIFYLTLFRMDNTSIAKRLDRLGLDERLITMVEYENDDSYMASVQRQDAKDRLAEIKKSDVKILIPTKLIVWSAVSYFLAIVMTVLAILASLGLIMGGGDVIDALTPEEPEINLSVMYEAEEGGSIDGECEQLVLKGKDAEPVLAVPDEGYIFIEWSDGSTDPYRHDREILEELELFAIFEWDEEGEEGDEGEEGEGEGEGDMEAPSEDQGEKSGEGEKSEESEDGKPSDKDEQSDQGKYGEANQVIDGETYYREILSEYKDKLIEYLEQNRDKLSEEEIAIIESYIGIV